MKENRVNRGDFTVIEKGRFHYHLKKKKKGATVVFSHLSSVHNPCKSFGAGLVLMITVCVLTKGSFLVSQVMYLLLTRN